MQSKDKSANIWQFAVCFFHWERAFQSAEALTPSKVGRDAPCAIQGFGSASLNSLNSCSFFRQQPMTTQPTAASSRSIQEISQCFFSPKKDGADDSSCSSSSSSKSVPLQKPWLSH